MLTTSARGQRGITLIEIILVSAIVAAAAAGLFVFAKKTSVTAAVEKEQRQVEDIVKTVESMFSLQPNFAALGTNGAEYLSTRGAARAGLNLGKDAGGTATLTTALGSGELNLAAWNVDTGTGPAIANSGYRLAYQGLTANECSRLVTASYPIAHQVSVAHNGLDDSAATALASRGKLTASPEQIAEHCSGAGAASVFLYFAPARAIAATTAATPVPAPRCNPVHETQQVACPAGQLGSITQERDGTCTGPGNALVYTVWTTTDNTCAAAVTPPPTVTPPVVGDSCTTVTFTQVDACPTAGQTGYVTRTRDLDTCSGIYTPWTTINTTCQAPPASAACTPQTQERVQPCSAGQTGSITQSRSSRCNALGVSEWITDSNTDSNGWMTFNNTCRGSATCSPQRETGPIPCGAGTYGLTTGERERFRDCASPTVQASTWSSWNILTPNLGCVACPAPITETIRTWRSRSAACPSGQLGTNTWEAEVVSTRTASYYCPAGTEALPALSYSAWSAEAETGAVRNVVKTCANACVAPAATTATRTSTPCPSGQSGVITESQTTSWTCPSATGSPVSSTSAWTVVSNTCAATCTAPAPTSVAISRPLSNQGRDVGCPAGQTGNHWQTRTVTESGTRTTSWACPGPTSSTTETWSGSYTYGAWTTTSNTCKAAPTCIWRTDVYSLAPNFGNLDGETVDYNDGNGGGCSASWGGRRGNTGNFSQCMGMIPSNPPHPGASYVVSEYTNWGGGMENTFGYVAQCN